MMLLLKNGGRATSAFNKCSFVDLNNYEQVKYNVLDFHCKSSIYLISPRILILLARCNRDVFL